MRDRESAHPNGLMSAFEPVGAEGGYNALARMHRDIRTLPSGEEAI
jgi:hypothetical protein